METTRHFTTKVYIVNNRATALHEHPTLGIRLPPGGHIERDQLPHEAGQREVYEETGLESELYRDMSDIEVPEGRPLPQPEHQILYNVDVHTNGEIGHQHIDFIYFAQVFSREINPAEGEVSAMAWEWYTQEELRESDLDPDTVQLGIEAIEMIETMD